MELFDKTILITVSQTPNIRDIQGKIADVLNLKLEEESKEGIKSVGSSLRGKSNADWKVAFHKLKNSEIIDDHVEGVGAALSCLKLSYDYLSDKEKMIFLMCSIFPEDYKISIEDMVRYAAGLGLGGAFSLNSVRDEIEAIINKLLESCLLMHVGESKEYVKMHAADQIFNKVHQYISKTCKNISAYQKHFRFKISKTYQIQHTGNR